MSDHYSKGAIRAARSPQASEIARRFGRSTKVATPHFEGHALVLPLISKEEARRVLARHAALGTPGAERAMREVNRADMMAMAMAAARKGGVPQR